MIADWLEQVGLYRSYTPKHHRQLRVKDLPKIPAWQLERDSNPRPFGQKATNLPMCHHATPHFRWNSEAEDTSTYTTNFNLHYGFFNNTISTCFITFSHHRDGQIGSWLE